MFTRSLTILKVALIYVLLITLCIWNMGACVSLTRKRPLFSRQNLVHIPFLDKTMEWDCRLYKNSCV